MYKLVIANRNYSSWSLRAWLYLTESKIPFEEIRLSLFTDSWSQDIAGWSPAGRVPVLVDGEVCVWDTMAIMEYLRHKHSNVVDWPEMDHQRAHALSISAEMHSGFLALRDQLPQNLRARREKDTDRFSDTCRSQIARIDEIWSECRDRYGRSGDWLFGGFSIADIMYAPVALRFITYDVPISAKSREFVTAIETLESVQKWVSLAQEEPESLSFIDDLLPAGSSPLTLG